MRPHAVTTAGADSYAYNANGDMTTRTVSGQTSTLAWDALRRLTSVTKGAAVTSFVYDADGQRLLRKTASDAVLYLDGQEVKLAGAALTVSRYYNHAGATVAQRTKTTATETTHWLAGDHQSSFSLAVNASTGAVSKQRYLPFGAARGPVNQLPTDRGFIGQTEDDSTDLVYLNARYYDAKLGRFISVDPLARPYQQGTLDCYGYAYGSPIGLSDPSGLTPGAAQAEGCRLAPGLCDGSMDTWRFDEEGNLFYVEDDGRGGVRACMQEPLLGRTCTDALSGDEVLTVLNLCGPRCLAGKAARFAAYLARQAYYVARAVANSLVSVAARGIAEALGLDCRSLRNGLTGCFGASSLTGTALTIGNVIFFREASPDDYDDFDRLLDHEEAHADQWASAFMVGFGVTRGNYSGGLAGQFLYAAVNGIFILIDEFLNDDFQCRNVFEFWAGFNDGGYNC